MSKLELEQFNFGGIFSLKSTMWQLCLMAVLAATSAQNSSSSRRAMPPRHRLFTPRTTQSTRTTTTTTTATLLDETVEAEIASHKFVFVAGVPHSGKLQDMIVMMRCKFDLVWGDHAFLSAFKPFLIKN